VHSRAKHKDPDYAQISIMACNYLLMNTASSILNIMTEAALVSTCPDGFLAVSSRIGCLLTTEESTSLEPPKEKAIEALL
jgi:hypothetical protein